MISDFFKNIQTLILSCRNLAYYYPSILYFYQTISFGIMTKIINTVAKKPLQAAMGTAHNVLHT